MGCSACQKAREARMFRNQSAVQATGVWELTMGEGAHQGLRERFDTKLAAMARNVELGGGGLIRNVG